ncbi:MAG: hypothetical protein DHS20C11_37730 [Lysobacteraceae bacterium]|nr:MAG: hypothetical protein DHS20C11_37730 [Xanthomonadaceae bacterium]
MHGCLNGTPQVANDRTWVSRTQSECLEWHSVGGERLDMDVEAGGSNEDLAFRQGWLLQTSPTSVTAKVP